MFGSEGVRNLKLFFLVSSVLLLSFPAQSKVFKNSYIKFELPPGWQCEMKSKAYLCRSKVSLACKKDPKDPACKKEIHRSRQAVIVFSAKEKSEIDTIANYLSHFSEAKKLLLKNGNTTQSKVNHAKYVSVQKKKWVDSLHLSSEIPHYFTRYLATINGNIAVLVTYTAHKSFYSQYSSQFFKGIKSMEVLASDLSKVNKNEIGSKTLSHPIDIPDEIFQQIEPLDAPVDDGLSPILFALAMLLAGMGVFIWLKSRKSS